MAYGSGYQTGYVDEVVVVEPPPPTGGGGGGIAAPAYVPVAPLEPVFRYTARARVLCTSIRAQLQISIRAAVGEAVVHSESALKLDHRHQATATTDLSTNVTLAERVTTDDGSALVALLAATWLAGGEDI